jgi:RNA polymerase sigma-70 factor, ECF subfamily
MDQQTGPLVARAQRGDAAAFAALYEAYAPAIHRYLRRRLDGPAEAVEDLTGDVFAKAFEKLGTYRERGAPFAAWLYRIAHNRLVDHLRARPRHAAAPLEEGAERAIGDEAGFGRVLDREELAAALARLGADRRRAVELRFLEDRSVAETAALMQRSEAAVKQLQTRGLATLRRQLGAPAPSAAPARIGRPRQAVA